jgi:serine phosphatase RsbU (regulator of sigma subunit)
MHLRTAVVAIALGAVFAILMSLDKLRSEYPAILTIGALTGLAIWVAVTVLLILFHPTLQRLPKHAHSFALVVLLAIGGISGWVVGLWAGNRLFGSRATMMDVIRHGGGTFMLVTAGVVVATGLIFRSFEAMRENLAVTMERLKQREWAEKELELARLIQTRLLPPPRVEGKGFSIASRNFPAHLVAGDFYDIVQHEDGSVAIIVADVAGKGMGASLIMASVKAVLPFVGRGTVEEAMTALNDKLVLELDRREFVALAYARFFPADGTLQLANAGFPDPYLIRGNSVEPLTVGGIRLPLGIRGDIRYQTLVTKLEPRDRLVFVSDGIPEAPVSGDSDQPLGYERLAQALRVGANERADEWLEEFLTRIRSEVREPLTDDWTALVLQFNKSARIAA